MGSCNDCLLAYRLELTQRSHSNSVWSLTFICIIVTFNAQNSNRVASGYVSYVVIVVLETGIKVGVLAEVVGVRHPR